MSDHRGDFPPCARPKLFGSHTTGLNRKTFPDRLTPFVVLG